MLPVNQQAGIQKIVDILDEIAEVFERSYFQIKKHQCTTGNSN